MLVVWMKENYYDLVYGGGNVGLMGMVVDMFLVEGGEVIGVMFIFLMEWEIVYNGIIKMYIVSDMYVCKKKMIELVDVYLVLFGGFGMLEEISEVIFWGWVGEYMNFCILYNVNGYYDLLVVFFDKMVEINFLIEVDWVKIFILDFLEEIGVFIDFYELLMIC